MSYTTVLLVFENEATAKAAVQVVANTAACLHHEVLPLTDPTAISLIKGLQGKKTSKRWCMCTKLDGIARDGFSTCTICKGQDAYGGSIKRGEEFAKVLDKNKEK